GSATQRRYVIVKNSEAEKHDRLVREDIVKEVQFRLDSLAQIEVYYRRGYRIRWLYLLDSL
ncbi:MAG: hypothetical protein AB7D08_09650, partial [Bacteroidales bacterium]